MTAAIRKTIRFLLNDEMVETGDIAATATLLDFLRLRRRLTGTKEGCAEGDCGACTVLVGRLADGGLVYETVNACIRFVGSLDATHVVTIEHLAHDGALHPVQQAMVDCHGSQCGFCTPGVVMSLYGLWLASPQNDVASIEKALQGNLCRCTGYAPIVRAAEVADRVARDAGTDRLIAARERTIAALKALKDGARIEVAPDDGGFIVPASVDDLASVLEARPQATIVAGSTDVGLWVTKQMRPIAPAVFIHGLDELHRSEESDDGIRFAACVTYSEAFASLSRHLPEVAGFWDRIGGAQVRNMGTLGGNIANGSPIGDTPPLLIALGARLTLRKGMSRRTIDLEDFFIDYGRQDRQPGEFVESIFVPRLPEGERLAVYKVSKRRDEDISALCGAFRVRIDEGRVATARIAFGGMAATPKRARAVEAALVGQPWNEATIAAGRTAFEADFKPLSDWRASADYRMLAAKNLLARFHLESLGEPAQIGAAAAAGIAAE